MKLLQTILVVGAILTSPSSIGADEYRLLDDNQTKNLKIAARIGTQDGHPQMLIPAIIYQESRAGGHKSGSSYIGIGQVSIVAIREVLTEHPDVADVCDGVTQKTPTSRLKKTVGNNDRCGISVASKYLKLMKDKYGFQRVEQQVVAYQLGPRAARRVNSNSYSKSVIKHKSKLVAVIE